MCTQEFLLIEGLFKYVSVIYIQFAEFQYEFLTLSCKDVFMYTCSVHDVKGYRIVIGLMTFYLLCRFSYYFSVCVLIGALFVNPLYCRSFDVNFTLWIVQFYDMYFCNMHYCYRRAVFAVDFVKMFAYV